MALELFASVLLAGLTGFFFTAIWFPERLGHLIARVRYGYDTFLNDLKTESKSTSETSGDVAEKQPIGFVRNAD